MLFADPLPTAFDALIAFTKDHTRKSNTMHYGGSMSDPLRQFGEVYTPEELYESDRVNLVRAFINGLVFVFCAGLVFWGAAVVVRGFQP